MGPAKSCLHPWVQHWCSYLTRHPPRWGKAGTGPRATHPCSDSCRGSLAEARCCNLLAEHAVSQYWESVKVGREEEKERQKQAECLWIHIQNGCHLHNMFTLKVLRRADLCDPREWKRTSTGELAAVIIHRSLHILLRFSSKHRKLQQKCRALTYLLMISSCKIPQQLVNASALSRGWK